MEQVVETRNADGKERKIGIEVEYAGLTLPHTAEIVQNLFGGDISSSSDAVYEVKETALGDFVIELDAIPLQKLASNVQEIREKADQKFVDEVNMLVGEAIGEAGTKIVPLEIVTPPVPLSRFDDLEKLREALYTEGAKGTKDSFYTAFGLHLNPEVVSLDVDYITAHIQSFLLLAPWLKKRHQIYIVRKLTSFIDPFPKSYLQLVLTESYQPDIERLIRDYHAHNPTRNRALDMLPLFAMIDEKLVRSLYGDKEKINKRPTFHYRLPNCEIATESWSFGVEYRTWQFVEQLAQDVETLTGLIRQWQTHQDRWFSFEDQWVQTIDAIMKRYDNA